jgi:anti-anti-sigma factor
VTVDRAAPFSCEIERIGQCLCVRLVGELDIATAPDADRAITDALGPDVTDLELDARRLEFVDSSGLRCLISAANAVSAANPGATVRLTGPTPPVRRVLEITGLMEVLGVAPQD